ncbi:MAG: protein translocase subunit SecD [Robiginitomaculum sp.]|nr:MAG: protein translocase subunit SecD [Robiginitomaculum sp.]
MLHFSKTKIFFILGAIILGLLFALPNALPKDVRDNLPWPLPRQTLNLGLDLQGGAHMLLSVDLKDGLERTLKVQRDGIRDALREERIRPNMRIEDEAIYVTFKSAADDETGAPIIRAQSENVDDRAIGGGGKTLIIENVGELRYKITVSDAYLEFLSARTIEQSIQVLRKRIDPSGTTEMTLAKEGKSRILLQVPGANNDRVAEIKKVIRRTAKLSFHQVDPADALTLDRCVNQGRCDLGRIAYPSKDGGGSMIVYEREVVTGADLKKSSEGIHPQNGNPIVNFTYNGSGARKFCKFTADHEGDLFAVVLDGEIITAPRINGAICGGRGYIEGSFTMASARELSLLLNAGALPAKLEIAQENTVGAELGKDSIAKGKAASIIGLVLVGIFMWFSYGFRFGTFANIALATNIILIAGALSILGATLTLPGIAGIILTIGMAVDANVLIFERIREETANGRGPINAVDTGYRLSLAPILDANVTTLIAALTLYFVGSGPIRGFAVTLSIGIVMSVFTAVVVARLMTAVWLRRARPKTLPI